MDRKLVAGWYLSSIGLTQNILARIKGLGNGIAAYKLDPAEVPANMKPVMKYCIAFEYKQGGKVVQAGLVSYQHPRASRSIFSQETFSPDAHATMIVSDTEENSRILAYHTKY